MVQPRATYLKIYREEPPEAAEPRLEDVRSLPALLRAFRQATGWSLCYLPGPQADPPDGLKWSTPANPGEVTPPGHLRLHPVGPNPLADAQTAQRLAEAIAGLLGELYEARRAVWQREAELAAGVPLVPHPEEPAQLATRLEATLRAAAQTTGCHAAAVYLLDEATTCLKLRSRWGLPWERFLHPTRPLEDALADLEAMLGHAVVLDARGSPTPWNPPEDYPAAVCLPLATPTTILGTVWFFSDQRRHFSDHDVAVLEIVAGRLASDLERAMLLREGMEGAQLKQQLAVAERLQRNQLPTVQPVVDHWQVGAWMSQRPGPGSAFYDWHALPGGSVAVFVGQAVQPGAAGAIPATTLKAALRAHAEYQDRPTTLLQKANLTLWTGSAGDQLASAVCVAIPALAGPLPYAMAGQVSVIQVRSGHWQSLSGEADFLGQGPQAALVERQIDVPPDHGLVLVTPRLPFDQSQSHGLPAEQLLGRRLAAIAHLEAEQWITACRDLFEADPSGQRAEWAAVVLKRTAP